MKRLIRIILTISILTTCFAAITWAESATKVEAISNCVAAAKLVEEKGVDQAAQIIGDRAGPFVWKDSYVFLMNIDGKMIAHPIKPKMTEEDSILQLTDINGKKIAIEFIKVASNQGHCWVNYMWPKPGHDQPAAKSTYIYRVANTPYFVGAGIYR